MANVGEGSAPKTQQLEPVWRVILCLLGVGAAFAGWRLVLFPPVHTAFPPQCKDKGCATKVSADQSTLATTLVVAGLVLALIAVNGVRVGNFEFAGAKFSVLDQAQRALSAAPTTALKAATSIAPSRSEPEVQPAAEPTGAVKVKGQTLEVFDPEAVPTLLSDVFANPPSDKKLAKGSIQFAARPAEGSGSPWLVGLHDGSLIKVDYSGPSAEPDVSLLNGTIS